MRKDPYKYFRVELKELLEGLSQGVLQLEKKAPSKENVERLLRFAHTLKGAARVVKQLEIAESAHSIEEVLSSYRDGVQRVPRESIQQLLKQLDTISARVPLLSTASSGGGSSIPVVAASSPIAEGQVETVRVEISDLDRVLEGISETAIQLTALRSQANALNECERIITMLLDLLNVRRSTNKDVVNSGVVVNRARAIAAELRSSVRQVGRELNTGLDHVDREIVNVREQANQLRLVPAKSLFDALERAARDAAQSLHKRVEFTANGGDTCLDGHVLIALKDALLHVVRNAVAHGIESEADRRSEGKPVVGRVVLEVERRGNRVAFVCKDDGRGIDVEAVRRSAVARGIVSAAHAESLNWAEASELIFRPGVTTSETVNEVSGRGVGLDVVRDLATRLKGECSVRSQKNLGTTFEIVVPVSLLSLSCLVAEAAGIVASFPLDAVRRTIRLKSSEIAHSAEGDVVLYEGKAVPFLPLARILQKEEQPNGHSQAFSAIVIEAASQRAVLGIDRIRQVTDVIVRPLPKGIGTPSFIAGACLDAAGNAQLVLDARDLIQTLKNRKARLSSPVLAQERPRILVIDDSLTTRMMEQTILESAGYDVDMATSAEEGLEKARGQAYRLFVCDLEMPGMSGLDFLRVTRADPHLVRTPAIMVTSRGSETDRAQGAEAGASAYIVKGEFDQGHFLQTVRSLVG